MKTSIRLLAALFALLIASASADAHFLFVRILPPAEGGRWAEVYFSDRADAGDPRFVEKIASTKLWAQTKPGEFEPLTIHQAADRLRALVPPSGSVAVIGECTYGVLARPKATPFLLRHYPKAIAAEPDDLPTMRRKAEIPFEIQVQYKGLDLHFVALRDGKPVPQAKFVAVGADLKDQPFTANAQGSASWRPTKPGQYAVFTSQTLKQAGAYQGEKYEEIREFATLAFNWPFGATGPNPEAVALFQEAIAARAAWHDFPGFTAQVKASADGRTWQGQATISAKGDVELGKADEVVAPWVREQLESMAMHRRAGAAGKTPSLHFADQETDHPLGRLLIFDGGKFASSYRVKDRQIMVVNRNMGKVNFTITVLDNDLNAEKKYLPRSYTVHYWDAKTGKLDRCETFQNRWTHVGAFDLPASLTMQTSSSLGQSVKSMTLTKHRLLEAK